MAGLGSVRHGWLGRGWAGLTQPYVLFKLLNLGMINAGHTNFVPRQMTSKQAQYWGTAIARPILKEDIISL